MINSKYLLLLGDRIFQIDTEHYQLSFSDIANIILLMGGMENILFNIFIIVLLP